MVYGKIYSIVNESNECCLCSKLRAMNQCAMIETDFGKFIICNLCAIKLPNNSDSLINPHTYRINQRTAYIVKDYIESILNEGETINE